MTGQASLLRPSPRLCPRAFTAATAAAAAGNLTGAPIDCTAPVLVASFSISVCGNAAAGGVGAYITAVRLADDAAIAWLVGGDTWEDDPAPSSLARLPNGLFGASGQPIRVDRRLPPLWRCTEPAGKRSFIGRAADGSGYFQEPEVQQQGAAWVTGAFLPRRGLNASQALFTPMGAIFHMLA